jgi:prepilin-type N-terminal cleavage/methylation domain-containing protein/prepilin-type processing-associated H-X9-DG protein
MINLARNFPQRVAKALFPKRRTRRQESLMHSAFTLTEMLVVLLIVAVLCAVLVPAMSFFRSRAYSARCTSNLRQLGSVMSHYMAENGTLPAPGYDLDKDGQVDSTHNWMELGPGTVNGPNLFRSVYPNTPFGFQMKEKPPSNYQAHLEGTIFECPAAAAGFSVAPGTNARDRQPRMYGMNIGAGKRERRPQSVILGTRLSNVDQPSATMFIMDGHGWFLDTFHTRAESAIGAKSFEYQSKRHNGHLNILYCDLHVGRVTPKEIPSSSDKPFWGWK